MNKKKILIAVGIVTSLMICSVGAFFAYDNHMKIVAKEKAEKERIKELGLENIAKKSFEALFSDGEQKLVKLEINKKDVNKVEEDFKVLTNTKMQETYAEHFKNILYFIDTRDVLRSFIPSNILKSDTSEKQITKLNEDFKKITPSYQPILKPTLDMITSQYQVFKDVDALANSFYVDGAVRSDIDAQEFARLQDLLAKMPQKDIAQKYAARVEAIVAKIKELEAIARAQAEAERQAAIAAQLAESQRIALENEKIAQANVIIGNIPHIDQKNGVLNGCEAASLLMGIQHFGALPQMTLKDFATAMPKHASDPTQGFVLDIFTTYPKNLPHWIAPNALAAFGQKYYPNVQDISGAGFDQLKAEIDAGNPVVFYATYGFYPTYNWVGGVPTNLHVMLLIGYNKINGNYVIVDPWGGQQSNVSKASFESSYLNKAVVIRGAKK